MKARSVAQLFVSALVLAACGEPPSPVVPPAPEPPAASAAPSATPIATAAPTAAPEVAPPEPAKLPPVEIKPGAVPASPAKMPKVTLIAPKANESIKADKTADFEVKLDIKDWEVATGGPHVHLILDNQPYKAIFEPKASIKLGDIAPGAQLGLGQHLLVAFPSRMTHVSVKPEKGKNPLVMTPFWIGKAGKDGWKKTDPTLIYSRPKGTYNGPAADDILLDFYLANVELGDKKYAVKATVYPPAGDPKTITISSWVPYSITNLPNGETRLKLELLDKDGKAVPGAWNNTERTIIVNRDAK